MKIVRLKGFKVPKLEKYWGFTKKYRNMSDHHRQKKAALTASNNTCLGYRSGFALEGADSIGNTLIGYSAGVAITEGAYNTFLGTEAGGSGDITGDGNNCIGYQAGYDLSSGTYNQFMGYQAGTNTTIGDNNIAIGYKALTTNVDGNDNIAIGNLALEDFEADAASHGQNVAIGSNAMLKASTGTHNTAMGFFAMGLGATTGNVNVAIG